MTGHEKHLREMIKGQQDKIARCLERIVEIENELSAYLTNLPPPMPPFSVAPKDAHDYCGKILYPSEKAAHSAQKLINRDLKKKGKARLERSYYCTRCEAWHLTTVPFPEHEVVPGIII